MYKRVSQCPHMLVVAVSSVSLLAATKASAVDTLLIDDFTRPIDQRTTLTGANGDDPFDLNGQAGVQYPVYDSNILGGERDSQFWVGYGPEEEEWTYGVNPTRGLYWDSDPGMHVNMNLEWDGFGDGTTFGGAPLAPFPLTTDVSKHTGIEIDFAYNTEPLFVRWILVNKDLEDPANTTPQGASRWQETIPGGQTEPFTLDMPFSEFSDPFVDFGIPPLDPTNVNSFVLSILSAPEVTGNSFELRSITIVPEPTSILLFGLGGMALLCRRKRIASNSTTRN